MSVRLRAQCYAVYVALAAASTLITFDVDYDVFTDAARLVKDGISPYNRHTYRYTPLLAYMCLPNLWWYGCMKVVFVALGIAAAWRQEKLLRMYGCAAAWAIRLPAIFWLFNPLVFAVNARGSADVVCCILTLEALYQCERRRPLCAGALLGLAVHFKIYPAIFAMPLAVMLNPSYLRSSWTTLIRHPLREVILKSSRNQWTFGLSALTVFAGLNAFCYVRFGFSFLYESYIYHGVRKDHRHNFSPFFYLQYLLYRFPRQNLTAAYWLRPQILLTALLGHLYRDAVCVSLFLASLVFVHYNKVITSQYFLWYLVFLPLVVYKVSKSEKDLPSKVNTHLVMIVGWFTLQVCWMAAAGLQEFRGIASFHYMAAFSLVFLVLVSGWVVMIIFQMSEAEESLPEEDDSEPSVDEKRET